VRTAGRTLGRASSTLKKGAEAASAANEKQSAMNRDLRRMTGAIEAQVPELRASINAS